MGGFNYSDWENFGVLNRWLLGGGHLRDVVTNVVWTVSYHISSNNSHPSIYCLLQNLPPLKEILF